MKTHQRQEEWWGLVGTWAVKERGSNPTFRASQATSLFCGHSHGKKGEEMGAFLPHPPHPTTTDSSASHMKSSRNWGGGGGVAEPWTKMGLRHCLQFELWA